MNIESEFVSYEQALALKELGFDERCNTCFDKLGMVASYGENVFDYKNYNSSLYVCSRPLKQQVFRWFREKYDAHIHPSRLMRNIYVVRYGDWDSTSFTTYEEAENACIDKLIEIAKQQDK